MSQAFLKTLLIISVLTIGIIYYAYIKEKNHNEMLKHELDVIIEQKFIINNELSKIRMKELIKEK